MTKNKLVGNSENKNTLDDLSGRFLAALKMVGYSGYRLAKEIDEINPQTVIHIRAGRNLPSTKVIYAFLKKFPNINAHWLFTGEGLPQIKPKIGKEIESDTYAEILNGIPVEEIINYIQNHQTRFDESEIFKTFLEYHAQARLDERMGDLEGKVEKILKIIERLPPTNK